ncbi:MAG: excisionase family DNA-binding protein [Acidimicrobiia bacterium]
MNLKEAANRLGVHYQTAYKWVRSGHLTAIRVGGRYEVSDAAIERFSARRAAACTDLEVRDREPEPIDVTAEDVLEELEAMAADPFVSTRSVARYAARRGAQLLGDLCVFVCFDEGGNPRHMAVDHPNAAHAAFVTAVIDAMGPASNTLGFAFSAFAEQRLIRLSHVPQDLLRDQIKPELRQHLSLNPIRCLLSVPIRSGHTTRGAITFARSSSDRPFTDEEELWAVQLGDRLGALLETATEVDAALDVRRRIAATLGRMLEFNPSAPAVSESALAPVLEEAGAQAVDLPVSILDPGRRFLAVNRTFRALRSQPGEEIIGCTFESITHAEDRDDDVSSFDRLASGELDYLDINVRRIVPDGREIVYASHRAAVRAPDASLRYFVTVARPLRLRRTDYVSVGPAPYRSIDAVDTR